MSMIASKLWIIATMGFILASTTDTRLSDEQIAKLRPSVLRIETESCGSGSHTGTGFRWGGADLVVTAWHVVSDCAVIQVHSDVTLRSYPAEVQAILIKRDLALLRLSKPIPQSYELRIASRRPDRVDDLTVLGYPENIPTLRGTSFHAAYGGRMLRDAVPNAVTKELQDSGFLSPDTEILNIDGHLAGPFRGTCS